jgi:hypothetical protein
MLLVVSAVKLTLGLLIEEFISQMILTSDL